MKFFRAFYLTGATSLIVTVIGFLNNVIVTRFLGPSGRGEYSVVMNIVLILSLILGEGLRRGNIIFVGWDKENIRRIVRKTFKFNLFLALLFIPIVYFRLDFIYKLLKIDFRLINLSLYLTIFLIFWRSLQSIFLGLEDYKKYNSMQFFYTFIFFVVNLLIIYVFKGDLIDIILSFMVSSIAVSLLAIWWIIRSDLFKINKPIQHNQEGLIVKATIASIFGFILLKGDIFLVNYFTNSADTGIYSITLVITDLFQKLPLILGPIVIARSVNKDENIETLNIAKMSRVLVGINVLGIAFLMLFGQDIISILFSDKFEESFHLLIYILPALLLFSSGHIINAFFIGRGFPPIVIVNSVVFSLLNILLNIIFIPRFGTIAAAINCSVSYLFWSISFLIYFAVKYNYSFADLFLMNKNDISELKIKLFANG